MNNTESSKFFLIKTTVGQEKNISTSIYRRIKQKKIPIKSILVPEILRGYMFIEANNPNPVEEAIKGLRHVRSRVPGAVPFSEIEKYILVKPIIEDLDILDLVEIRAGPFKGMRAKITDIERTKEEITIELLEATFTLPIKVHADYVRIIEKKKLEDD